MFHSQWENNFILMATETYSLTLTRKPLVHCVGFGVLFTSLERDTRFTKEGPQDSYATKAESMQQALAWYIIVIL